MFRHIHKRRPDFDQGIINGLRTNLRDVFLHPDALANVDDVAVEVDVIEKRDFGGLHRHTMRLVVVLEAILDGDGHTFKQVLRHIVQQIEFVIVMVIESRAVIVGCLDDILDGNVGKTFCFQ